jgi:hypothetical protein
MECGVDEEQTIIMGDGKQIIFDVCKPGDLLVLMMGHVEKHQIPVYIDEYAEKMRDV